MIKLGKTLFLIFVGDEYENFNRRNYKELEEEILISCHEVDDEICDVIDKLKTENLITRISK